MKKLSQPIAALLFLCLGSALHGQISWTTQYMGRAEYRHGFSSPAATNAKPGLFIGQRARIGIKYNADKFKVCVNLQDIRTWGQTANGTIDQAGLLSLHEGYVELMPSKHLSLKLGRQEIAYDEDRIFGSLDWALQARRHDAALVRYEDSTWKAHLGLAYNQDNQNNFGTIYNVAGNYKTFQYAYVSKQLKDLNLSLLFLNNGLQWKHLDSLGNVDKAGVRFSQTAGLRAGYSKSKFGGAGTFYYQMGKDANDKDLAAFQASAELWFKPIDQIKLVGGYEILSGTSQTDTANTKNNSFTPFYGTNHRFNGYMDLFYVNNYTNTVGLQDPYAKVVYASKKVIGALEGHMFMASSDIRDLSNPAGISAMPGYLGTEIDASFLYSICDFVAIQAGYSHFLPTESFAAVRGGDINETQNWAYLMLLVRPGAAQKFPRSGLKL